MLISIFAENTKSQDFKKNFQYNDVLKYRGALFKVKDEVKSELTTVFYSDIDDCLEVTNNVVYPDKKWGFSTIMDSLKNRIFLVQDVLNQEKKTFQGEKGFSDKIVLSLQDIQNDDVIYYYYDDISESSFPFLIADLEEIPISEKIAANSEKLCEQISIKTDDFTGATSISTPTYFYKTGDYIDFSLNKSIEGVTENYYLILNSYGSTLNVGKKGAIILFRDGSRMNKPNADIDVSANAGSSHEYSPYRYTTFIPLSKSDVKILSERIIDKYRLFIYDLYSSEEHATKFKYYVQCILKR
jgi:hypothetical protein